jgi:hypothetical protein
MQFDLAIKDREQHDVRAEDCPAAVTSRNIERATLVSPITSTGILFRSGRGRRHPV